MAARAKYAARAWRTDERLSEPVAVLEPSAGTGALILPCPEEWQITACEVDPTLARRLEHAFAPPLTQVLCVDFLRHDFGAQHFDIGLSNPPFEGGQDLAFTLKLFALCDVVIQLVREPFMHRTGIYEAFWSRPDVQLTWRGDCVPRPRFGGKYNPQDEYVAFEIVHGLQGAQIDFTRIVNPKLLERLKP
jgi:predicted RNA methylase